MLIWLLNGDPQIPQKAKEIIMQNNTKIYFSVD